MAVRLRFTLFAAFLAVTSAHAEVQLARVFSDHMVLQAHRPVPVWGTAIPGERITVNVAAQTKTTVAGNDGRWRVTLDPLDYARSNAPQTILVSGTNEIRVADVLIVTLPPDAPAAKYVRYGWQDYFTPGLFNAFGLPASPFRTDSFPLTTEK